MRKEKEVVFICYAFEYSTLIHIALHCVFCADVMLELWTRTCTWISDLCA